MAKRHYVGKKRLIKLRDFLDTKVRQRPKELFDMLRWLSQPFKNQKMDCDTVACAFGYATVLWPKELIVIDNRSVGLGWSIGYEGFENLEAAARFFDLDTKQAAYIFAPYMYTSDDYKFWQRSNASITNMDITIDMVIQHINQVLSEEITQ